MSLAYLYQNKDKYASVLDRVHKEAGSNTHKSLQLNSMAQPDRARVSTSTFTHKIDKRVDLTYPVGLETEEAPEEVVLRVQGFVIWADLPPIHSYQRLPRNVLSAKQAIRLTGLGREAFDACAVAILEIQQILSGQLPPNSLQRYQPGTEQGYLTLEFANRYFTVSNNSDDQEVPMNTYIDPVSVLRERVPANAKHTADNEVLYFEKRTTTSGVKYTGINPAGIQVGNLVEVQVAFCVVPIAKGKFKMLLKLRSICVLDRSVESDKNREAIESLRTMRLSPVQRVKRKVGYGYSPSEHDTDEACTEMKRLKFGSQMDNEED